MPGMAALLTDHEITERVLSHIANRSTDAGEALWREPVENYRSRQRFEAEMQSRYGPPPEAPAEAPAEKVGAMAGFMQKLGIGKKADADNKDPD